MIIPESVQAAFEHQEAVLSRVAELAGGKIRELCNREHWLYDQRHKPVESALAKLEAGRSLSLAAMDDLWAALVVVPTTAEVPAAASALLNILEGVQKPRRSSDPLSFPYDDVHVTARLGSTVASTVAGPEVRNRNFEVQIHTGLQYAWWRATHDTLYKGAARDWRTQRAASQARASLELLDTVLGNLHGAGQLQQDAPLEVTPDELVPAEWLDLWRAADRPQDVLRFCQTVSRLARACGLSLAEIDQALRTDANRELIGERDLTPGQAVTIVAADLAGVEFGPRLVRAEVRVLVTPEMESRRRHLRDLSPEARSTPEPSPDPG